jgi:hypothetical protein
MFSSAVESVNEPPACFLQPRKVCLILETWNPGYRQMCWEFCGLGMICIRRDYRNERWSSGFCNGLSMCGEKGEMKDSPRFRRVTEALMNDLSD